MRYNNEPQRNEVIDIKSREIAGKDKIKHIILRINEAVKSSFTGTIKFEINLNQGGIRSIKSSVENLLKF